MQKTQEQLNAQMKERSEHDKVLNAIKDVLATQSGRHFIKYLLKSFDVAETPEIGLPHDVLLDKMGFLRAGNSIFKIVSQANHEIAGALLAQIEKEKYEELLYDSRRE
jgi:hypothetical protein